MEELLQKAIKRGEEERKRYIAISFPWKTDEPHAQQYYIFDSAGQDWKPAKSERPQDVGQDITRLAVYNWNIDCMLPHAEDRMKAALVHLEGLTSQLPPTTAAVIFLQECVVSDLTTVSENGWIRDKFYITDRSRSNWTSKECGTTTLVDRRLSISSCFRVHYEKTRMARDAFFVDVSLGGKTIRLCNTHLESLALEPPLRPAQMQLAAKFMHADGIHGALAAGDFNAIQPFDRTLHSDNNLKDAYLELGGKEDSDEGYTWGQQASTGLRNRFGCSRMDKVFFRGGLKLLKFERFGGDVQLSEESQKEDILALGFEKPWITDHLGVVAEVEISD
ncbi:Endonuclease/exonuclease/phosphatase [Whalleya microplaca]|nr:Endonuclease/exonuclease/phosphatase [Whalleya microplaca]